MLKSLEEAKHWGDGKEVFQPQGLKGLKTNNENTSENITIIRWV